MDAGASLKSKALYKLFILLLKYVPFLITGCYIINTVARYYGMDLPVLSNLAGMSLLPWIFMYVAADLFRFCIYHKSFLYYILTVDLLNIYDYYFGILVETSKILEIHFALIGILLFSILIIYVKNHKRLSAKDSK